jgi:hypothetical protein
VSRRLRKEVVELRHSNEILREAVEVAQRIHVLAAPTHRDAFARVAANRPVTLPTA